MQDVISKGRSWYIDNQWPFICPMSCDSLSDHHVYRVVYHVCLTGLYLTNNLPCQHTSKKQWSLQQTNWSTVRFTALLFYASCLGIAEMFLRRTLFRQPVQNYAVDCFYNSYFLINPVWLFLLMLTTQFFVYYRKELLDSESVCTKMYLYMKTLVCATANGKALMNLI